MRRLIAAINMTLDGFCDHTSGIADDETHQHYSDLLKSAGVIIFGRITYHLMESYWPGVVANPTGNKPTDEFAVAIANIQKVVFSHTLRADDPTITGWKNVKLAQGSLKEEVVTLKQQPGKDILVGSPSLIVSLMKLNLIDEYQLTVHPIIAGSGLTLFKNISETVTLELLKTKVFRCGAITLYYEPKKK